MACAAARTSLQSAGESLSMLLDATGRVSGNGAYPERRDSGTSALDSAAERLARVLRRHRYSRRTTLRRVAKLIVEKAEGLEAVSDPELRERAMGLRYRLRAEGLNNRALAAQAFALVRETAGRVLGMKPFDVQLMGGWVMLHGMLAEMETGEGKTLTATLPACTAALAGIPVHVITVNDYLVGRDAESMRPLYEALGLSVGTITEEMDPGRRRAAYACDVTYCTNKQLVFDYLRDRLTLGNKGGHMQLQLERLYEGAPRLDRLLLRGLHFAIVDEADSVLIDEARTPLIISGAGGGNDQEAVYAAALEVAADLEQGRDYELGQRQREVTLTEAGRARLAMWPGPTEGPWRGRRGREELVRMALSARHLFVRDRDYLVRDDRVQIVDEYTGRVMADRAWERGLHQLIEAKEGCRVTGQKETLARISYQRFFRRYIRLAGMSGTAQEVAGELSAVYRLGVVRVPPNRPVRRRPGEDGIYPEEQLKWTAIVRRIAAVHERGQPVLVGTRSVEASEHLSNLLRQAGLAHEVLNARQDEREAEIISRAGERGRITVATNMAGRGTDIRLGAGVAKLGGLHVIASERHEARRIDRQLFGRCARQGEPGSHEAIVSVQDDLVERFAPPHIKWLLQKAARGRYSRGPGRWALRVAQRAAERQHARLRRDLLRTDEQLARLLAFSGQPE